MDDRVLQAWEEAGAIDPQRESPLYNGRIPVEIRMLILELAVTETVESAFTASQDWRLKQSHEVDPDSDLEDEESCAEDCTGRGDDDLQAESSHEDETTAGLQDHTQHTDENENHEEYDEESDDDYFACSYDSDYDGHIFTDHINHPWDRPDASGPRKTSPVLRLCRRTYIELTESRAHQGAWSEMRFFGQRGPNLQPMPDTARPRRARFYTQMYWLSDTFYRQISLRVPGVFEKLRDIRLTFRRGDWWHNEENAELHVDPFGTGYERGMDAIRLLYHQQVTSSRGHAFLPSDTDAHVREMRDSHELHHSSPSAIGTGAPMLFPARSWALAFAQLPSLEKLTIDFETAPDKREEMDLIVDWAVRDWIFPMYVPWRHDSKLLELDELDDGGEARERFLSAAGSSVHKTSWRGLPQHYSPLCPDPKHVSSSECASCAARRRRKSRHMGPRLLVWTVTWTPRHALKDGTELVFREVPLAPPSPHPVENLEDDFMRRYREIQSRFPQRTPPRGRWGFRPRRTVASPT